MDKIFGSTRHKNWPKVRKEYLKKQPNCAICDKKANTVHHIIPVHINKDLELIYDNFITLCSIHHLHFGHLGSYHSYNPEIKENAELWNKKWKTRP